MPDANDIIFTSYGLDIRPWLENLVGLFGDTDLQLTGVFDMLGNIWFLLTVVGIILSILSLIIFIIATVKVNRLSEIEIETLVTEPEQRWREHNEGLPADNRWTEIEKRLESANPSEWRVAIIEADIFLGEVLTEAGYPGTTIGEQLKGANPANFGTVEMAWQAHKVRNEIAHAGSDFILTQKLARQTITQYRQVFSEFDAI